MDAKPKGLEFTKLVPMPHKVFTWVFVTFFFQLLPDIVQATVFLEATTRGVLCKKVFLEISQNSQENSFNGGFF